MRKETTYLFGFTALYLVLGLLGILHHELWLDEAHHFVLARDSNSMTELFQYSRQDGHPIFWNVLLYGLTRFTVNPFWMQFLHILISTSVVFLFLRKAPFSLVFKTLFIFGYFMLFEYNLISRNYILGIFFLFCACVLFEKRKEKFWLLCLFLVLAINTHFLFSVPALALFSVIVVEQIQEHQLFKKELISGYSVFGLGLLLLIFQINSTDSAWLLEPVNQLSFRERTSSGFGTFFKGIIALPDFRTVHFWNTNLIVSMNKSIAGILALLVYFLPLLLFKNRKTLFFTYIALIGLQIFFFVTQRTATRFHGMSFLLIIIGLWIEPYFKPSENQKKLFFRKPIIYSILLIHFGSGIYAYTMDYAKPFTAAKATADFLKKKPFENNQIVTASCEGTLISAYLGKKVYFLSDGSYESFCHWDSDNFSKINEKTIMETLSDYTHTKQHFTYVSNYPIGQLQPNVWTRVNDKVRICFLKSFNGAIIRNGDYYVYDVSKI